MMITTEQILAVCAALVLLANVYEKYDNLFGKKKKKLRSDVDTLQKEAEVLKEAAEQQKKLNVDMAEIQQEVKELKVVAEQQKKESKVLCKGILACLRGLAEQGCNGPVKDGIKEMEEHLLNSSH